MALQFKKATAVAVGTFNIYVIQPKWLTEIGQISEGARVKIEANFDRPGFRFSYEDGSICWAVQPDRLVIESTSASDDCGSKLAEILDKLKWTPLRAIGINAEFGGDASELESLADSCGLPNCHIPSEYELKQRTIHVAVKKQSQVFNAQLSAHEKGELSVNVHTDLDQNSRQEDINKAAIEVCGRFHGLLDEATKLASTFFNLELKYERNSD